MYKNEMVVLLIRQIDLLKEKMENQIRDNRPYCEIYETSVAIDELLVRYYRKYGISGNKHDKFTITKS